MTALTKIYLKSFLLFFFPFAILMALWEYIDNNQVNILALVLQSFIFAALMSWASVTGQKRALKKAGVEGLTKDSFNVHQTAEIEKDISLVAISFMLKNNETTRKWKQKREASSLVLKTKTSWHSWGEVVRITPVDQTVKIESRPTLKTTLFDYGKNLNNVRVVKELLLTE